jgi:hypothetical protein
MKVTKIEVIDGIYHVTQTPNLIERLFGKKEIIERYKKTSEVYFHFPHINVFIKSNGAVLSPIEKMTKVLNNFDRSF